MVIRRGYGDILLIWQPLHLHSIARQKAMSDEGDKFDNVSQHVLPAVMGKSKS